MQYLDTETNTVKPIEDCTREQLLKTIYQLEAVLVKETKNKNRDSSLRLVIVESPYSGDVEANTLYARRCIRDSLARGEAPIASHLLYTQEGILDDTNPAERGLGMEAGHAWLAGAEAVVVYTGRGISQGMLVGIKRAEEAGVPVEYRRVEHA